MLEYMTFLLVIVILFTALYTFHKVRRAHVMLYENRALSQVENNNMFDQLQALQGLYIDLDLRKSLPSTRGWAASPDFLRELYLHALAQKPQVVVECSSGTSTVVLARCMQMNGAGKVYSLENDPEYAEKTRRNLERHGLLEWATVLHAPLRMVELNKASYSWYALESLPADLAIDMLVIDGPPGSTNRLARYPAGPLLFPRLTEHAAVFMDDAAREDEKTILQLWQKEFPNFEQTSRFCEKGCAVLIKRGAEN